MADDRFHDEDVAWDRVGQFLGDMASVAQSVWNRNITLWSSIADNIRSPDKDYNANAMATDASKAMAAAFDNFDDVWSAITRPPASQRVATAVPTAFLYFRWQEGVGPHKEGAKEKHDAGHALVDPVWLLVPPQELTDLPKEADIELYGPADGVERLQDNLSAQKQPRGYLLQAVDIKELKHGTYSGAVYVTKGSPRVLANLRVVVEKKPK
jgi:hypothetical protein